VNLHGIVSNAIGAINPNVNITIERSMGNTTSVNGRQVPQYAAPVTVLAQVQSLTFGDLSAIEGLNIQGVRRAVYINGRTDGIIRPDQKGGDLVTLADGTKWLNVHVLEYWPDWCKFVITRQMP
jgi:hypothetical protein